jgi:hypothetical protein
MKLAPLSIIVVTFVLLVAPLLLVGCPPQNGAPVRSPASASR